MRSKQSSKGFNRVTIFASKSVCPWAELLISRRLSRKRSRSRKKRSNRMRNNNRKLPSTNFRLNVFPKTKPRNDSLSHILDYSQFLLINRLRTLFLNQSAKVSISNTFFPKTGTCVFSTFRI